VTAACSLALVRATALLFSIQPVKLCMRGQNYVKSKAEGEVLFQLVQKQSAVRFLFSLPLDGTPGKTRRCHLEQRLASDEHICYRYALGFVLGFLLERVRGSARVSGQNLLFKPFLAFCIASMGGIQGVTMPIAFRVSLTCHVPAATVVPHAIIFFPCTICLCG